MQEIIINKEESIRKICVVEDGKLVEQYEDSDDKNRIEGNIYIGKVQNILQGMQAAFVDIGKSKNAFIHLKDVLPKVDIKKEQVDISNENIKDYIKRGQKLLVQVKRDSTIKKGARVSSHISLVGRFLVLMPDTDIITLSQKIENKKEKERLTNIVTMNIPENMGAIIRTAASGKKDMEIVNDLNQLIKRWKKICEKLEKENEYPVILEENNNLTKKIILDLVDSDINRIIVNKEEIKTEVEQIVKDIGYKKEIKIEVKENAIGMYDLNTQMEKAKNRKIWLKCGGFITIDKTEALTAIDVNSGKYTGEDNLEDTILKVNEEASEEIARQVRLRDIGGIIVIDYIDMNSEEDKKNIINLLEKSLKKDRSKTQILEFTKLNLLELTRKHMFSND